MDMLSVALDITTVVIIILITATSIKRGLITSIIEFVGGILSAVGSAFLGWFFAIASTKIIKVIIINIALTKPNKALKILLNIFKSLLAKYLENLDDKVIIITIKIVKNTTILIFVIYEMTYGEICCSIASVIVFELFTVLEFKKFDEFMPSKPNEF